MFKARFTMSARVSPSPIVHPPVCLLDNAPKPIFYNIFGRIVFELDTLIPRLCVWPVDFYS